VTQILSQQLSVPWVSLYHTDFSRQLLNHVPQDLAEQLCLIPIFMRRVRGYGNVLYVAMDDPTNDSALREIEQFSGLVVRAMIAPPSHIQAAIRAYYGPSEPPDAQSSLAPDVLSSIPPSNRVASAVLTQSAPSGGGSESGAAPEELAPESGPVIEAREVSMPPPRRRSGARLITLTLLDGTKVNLPASSSSGRAQVAAQGEEVLTARDMVAALRAVAHGADASEILGDKVNWQGMFATLLSLLLRKHLIADWEFVEEYKKL
jgi:type IV pilus assembly protein PilB